MTSRVRHPGTCLAAALVLAACEREAPPTGDVVLPSGRTEAPGSPVVTTGIIAGPMGIPPAGEPPPAQRGPAAGEMPLDANAFVVAEGKRLYQWFNCAGCHGLNGGGGMGPPFADGDWIYGSEPAVVFQSIVQGRPGGMPAFRTLADDHVWKLVAYVRTLGPVESAGGAGDGAGEATGNAPGASTGGAPGGGDAAGGDGSR